MRICFNSLQTGKPIQRNPNFERFLAMLAMVSIPFKRESLSKEVYEDAERYLEKSLFQFPSNGKAYPKSEFLSDWRDTVGKEFQFPSNGKADPKQDLEDAIAGLIESFNSLQTGKQIQSLIEVSDEK